MKASAFAGAAMLALLSGCMSTQSDKRSVAELSGVEMYERLCASCRGRVVDYLRTIQEE